MSNYNNNHIARYAAAFRALANPNRLRIFLRLAECCKEGGTCTAEGSVCECVGELGRDLKIGLPTVSHHLRELRQAGMIEMERRGKNVDCRVRPEVLAEFAAFFTDSPNCCTDGACKE
jgi:ArsR family transcriptional regulator